MWQTSIKGLLLATFWFGVGTGALLIQTKGPFAILWASFAYSAGAFSLVDLRRTAWSEKMTWAVYIRILASFLICIGLGSALLGR